MLMPCLFFSLLRAVPTARQHRYKQNEPLTKHCERLVLSEEGNTCDTSCASSGSLLEAAERLHCEACEKQNQLPALHCT